MKDSSSPSRRNFIAQTLVAGAALGLTGKSFAVPAQNNPSAAQELSSIKGRKVLAVWGGYAPHEPDKCVNLFAAWMKEQGAEVIISNDLAVYTNASLLSSVDLIVHCWTMGALSKEQDKGLLEAVAGGCGLAGWHGGLCDSMRANTNYQFMTGGQWTAHPGGIIDYSVDITDSVDP